MLVRAVPGDLDRAVSNLIDNAAKWSPEGGGIEIDLRATSDEAVLEIRDHGPGIPPDELPFVFDRFYRGDHSRHVAGSGLGFAIVRKIVDAHHGTVGAGTAPGGGTSVVLRLPRLKLVPQETEP